MKNLVLITSNFPFGTGETFIETEFLFLYAAFDKVTIVSQNTSSKETRSIPGNVTIYRYRTSTSLAGFITLPALIIKNSKLILTALREEFEFRRQIAFKLSIRQKAFLIRKILKAIQLRDFIKSRLASEHINSSTVFYSYWLNSGAHAISMFKTENCLKIARAHGSDLYEEKNPVGFLPLLIFTEFRLDAIFFTSEGGKRYFENKTRLQDPKLCVSRLGVTRNYPLSAEPANGKEHFTIVSCSNLIPLKRVDLIIRSLGLIDHKKSVRWIHFGDGILRKELENLAYNILRERKRITYEFRGQVPNSELMNFYSANKTGLFLNTSSTEGIPVSIMEAQSFGIPAIASDVGAVREIVSEGTGSLLPPDFKPEDLAKLISKYMDQESENADKMREKIIANWEQNYNARKNYSNFVSQVISIFESSLKK